MKDKFISFYFDVAERVAQLSHAQRLKVGAVIVKDDRILSYGYNGTPAGFDNCCETVEKSYDERSTHFERDEWTYDEKTKQYTRLRTKPEVIHAEMNCLHKIAKSTDSSEGSVLFVTHSPCIECAKAIVSCGIVQVYYKHEYRSDIGIIFLKKAGIVVDKL